MPAPENSHGPWELEEIACDIVPIENQRYPVAWYLPYEESEQ